jgi:class 3 adenylate cyclase
MCARVVATDDRIMELNPMVLARPFLLGTVAMANEGFALPGGTVTFLLTDVEGSTRLWETRVSAGWEAAANGAISGRGGRIFKSLEKGGIAVFESAAAAVDAASTS